MFTWVIKKCRTLIFKVNFLCQFSKSFESFWFFVFVFVFLSKNFSLKKDFCYCHFLKTSIFEPLCFRNGAQFLWSEVCEGQIKNYFYFTDCFVKIYSLLTRVRKTPPLRSQYSGFTFIRTFRDLLRYLYIIC